MNGFILKCNLSVQPKKPTYLYKQRTWKPLYTSQDPFGRLHTKVMKSKHKIHGTKLGSSSTLKANNFFPGYFQIQMKMRICHSCSFATEQGFWYSALHTLPAVLLRSLKTHAFGLTLSNRIFEGFSYTKQLTAYYILGLCCPF